MRLNLHLLLPEWILCGTLILTVLVEMAPLRRDGKQGNFLPALTSLGMGLAFLALLPFTKKIDVAFGGMFLLDPFSVFFKIFFTLTAIVIVQMSRPYFSGNTREREFLLVLICTLLGFFFLVSANDFLLLFISLEIVTLSFYILTAYAKGNLRSIEAGLKYLILGSLASAFFIYGVSLLYIETGSTSFPAVRETFLANPRNPLMLLGALMILTALGFKVAAFPFQFWVPDVYEGAPTPTVSFLAVASKAAGFAILMRIVFTVLASFESQRALLFSALAAMTLVYGNLGALVQTNIKRLFGYSSIGHAGYLLMGLAAGNTFGTSAILYYLVAYAFTTLSVFFVIALAGKYLQSDEMRAYNGLGQRSPFLAAVMFLALLSSAGVPPLAGFSGKFFILLAAVQGGLAWLALLGALSVAVSLYYYLRIVHAMYFEESLRDEALSLETSTQFLLLFLSAGILAVGLWQAPWVELTQNAVRFLF